MKKIVLHTRSWLASSINPISLYLLMRAIWATWQHKEVMLSYIKRHKLVDEIFLFEETSMYTAVLNHFEKISQLFCKYSILSVLSFDEILYFKIHKELITSEMFNNFVDSLLDCMNPFPQSNSVLICDNASIHYSEAFWEMIEAWWALFFELCNKRC